MQESIAAETNSEPIPLDWCNAGNFTMPAVGCQLGVNIAPYYWDKSLTFWVNNIDMTIKGFGNPVSTGMNYVFVAQ